MVTEQTEDRSSEIDIHGPRKIVTVETQKLHDFKTSDFCRIYTHMRVEKQGREGARVQCRL